jgi:hypothetical protein
VEEIERVQTKVKWPLRKVCSELGVSYSSFMRWKERRDKREPLLNKPGPDKVEPLDIVNLFDEILALSHGNKRTGGTGALYEKYRAKISRRELLVLVEATRREIRREKNMMMRRIDWKNPGIVWSLDDTEHKEADAKKKLHMTEDLGSKYKFQPLTGDKLATGEEVASHLDWLFEKDGAPLVLKRDNHANLNNAAVDEVLSRHMVIPLNSPAYYPPYNGAMERSQGEMKRQLESTGKNVLAHIQTESELAAHDLNHKSRRSLKGDTACERFSGRKMLLNKYDKRKRKEVFGYILAMAVGIVRKLGLKTTRELDHAWRLSVETWLRQNGHITVSVNGKVLPYLP